MCVPFLFIAIKIVQKGNLLTSFFAPLLVQKTDRPRSLTRKKDVETRGGNEKMGCLGPSGMSEKLFTNYSAQIGSRISRGADKSWGAPRTKSAANPREEDAVKTNRFVGPRVHNFV